MKHIVVIDSGLNHYSGLRSESINRCINVSYSNDTVQFSDSTLDEVKDDTGHGTSVMAILQNYCADDKFIVIKAYNDEFEIPSFVITKTLSYVNENIECNIINMSCGCVAPQDKTEMLRICETLKSKGVVIVAAFSNEGMISYPAAFENVIGVDYSLTCFSPKEFYYIENSMIDIRGIGHPQNLPIHDTIRQQQSGASFVAPHITGYLMQKNCIMDLYAAKDYLKSKAKEVVTFFTNDKKYAPFMIKRAVIFPYSKEVDVLLRFSDMLPFEISGVLCTKHQFLSVSQRFAENKKIYGNTPIYTIDNYPWIKKDADTMIIGHVNLIGKALKTSIKNKLLGLAIEHKLNVYMFDEIDNDEALIDDLILSGNKFFITKIANFKNCNYGKLHSFCAPIVAIFGTGPKQGKFSLQLSLRQYLTSIGYKVANFASEPTATLFGFESCYPYGYNSTVHISGEDAISYVNYELARIDQNNPDIIFVGTQSQTIPTGVGNIGFYNHKQYEIILATQPDAHLLCIYVNDEITYIIKTIKFLESINDSKVIGIVIFPFIHTNVNGILSDERELETEEMIKSAIKRIEASTGKPVFSLFDTLLNEKLLEIIQDTFS